MAKLSDRTRRLWTTLLFFLGGPALLGFVAFRLYWRTTDAALDRERERLTAATRFDVDFADRRFLRPGVRRFLNATFSPPSSDDPAVFCPEIYLLTDVDEKTFATFVDSFDKRSDRGDVSDSNENNDAPDNADSNETFVSASRADAPTTRSLLFGKDDDLRGDALLAIVPTIYCRDRDIFQAKNRFCDEFLRFASDDVLAARSRALCVVAEQVVFQDETAFRETLAAAQSAEEPPTPRSTSDLKTLFRVAAAQTDRGAADVSESTTEREVVAFASEAPTLERFRALLVDSPERRRLEALFELRKISCARPLFVSFETALDASGARFEFESGSTPTPSVFAARFFPFFRSLSPESWFVGSLAASDAPEFGAEFFPSSPTSSADSADAPPVERVWTTRLDGFRLFRCDLKKLTARVDLPRFSGVVSEFSVERGATRRGVFLGSGSLRVVDGAFPQSFWSRLCADGRLRVLPPQTLSYRFMNDATPFNVFEILFETRPDGIVFDSRYNNKIVAVYRENDLTYQFHLDKSVAGRPLPYAEPLRALFETRDAREFWTPLTRAALNHLPLERAVPRPSDAKSNVEPPRLDAVPTLPDESRSPTRSH
ncbi:MAG: hypothetical protein IKU86_13005 [Thermoguttaceae bacterium]|nr:hypothetical protein [Thermoguttaceae bacterium]